MIAQNPLFRSVAVVTLSWYVALFVFSGLHGVPFWRIIYVFPASVAIATMGAAAGFALSVFLQSGDRLIRAHEITRGSSAYGATVLLGSVPRVPAPARGSKSQAATELAGMPWWPMVKARAPLHADAIQAVVATMLAIPRLPASPYPGGHGGRSLLEHSLAVSTEMLKQAPKWSYEGQRDKRGNIRVPLANPDQPHRFVGDDAPLLLLTGLAHDIGKMACYQVQQTPNEARLHRVMEIRPNHDTEGARMLRRVPEIMRLPLADRTALLMAVGYYHHPFALPSSGWMTDRMRSLTELLAKADIAVGVSEGHTLTNSAPLPDEEEETGGLAPPVPDAVLHGQTGLGLQEADDDDLDMAARLAGVAGAGKPAAAPAPPPRKSTAAPAQSAVDETTLPMELRLFMAAIRKPGAINGRERNQRLAWKHGENVYVMDKVMRTMIHNQGGADPVWAATAMAEANGNAAPYTASLAQQLLDRRALVNEHDGQTFSPARALFRMKTPSGHSIPVLIVRASAIPGAGSIKDCEKPIEIMGPLWGAASAKNKSEPPTAPAPAPAAAPAPAPEPAPLPRTVDYDDLSGPAAHPAPPPAAASLSSELDDDDFPFELPPAPAPEPDPAETMAEEAKPPAPAPPDVLPEQMTQRATALDAAGVLAGIIDTDEFRARYDFTVREKDGLRNALLPLESAGGQALTDAIDKLRESGADVSRIKIARLGDTGQRAYVVPLEG